MFHAVLERETISENILEEGFSYNLSCFYMIWVSVKQKWEK
jgi:hypothetical protein